MSMKPWVKNIWGKVSFYQCASENICEIVLKLGQWAARKPGLKIQKNDKACS